MLLKYDHIFIIKWLIVLIHVPLGAIELGVHLCEISPSGHIHPKVVSITIQTPSSPQNECSQTATKRRAIIQN